MTELALGEINMQELSGSRYSIRKFIPIHYVTMTVETVSFSAMYSSDIANALASRIKDEISGRFAITEQHTIASKLGSNLKPSPLKTAVFSSRASRSFVLGFESPEDASYIALIIKQWSDIVI